MSASRWRYDSIESSEWLLEISPAIDEWLTAFHFHPFSKER